MDVASVLTLSLLAIYLAVQPWSVLGGILLVTSDGGVKKESAYVAGWVFVFKKMPELTGRSLEQIETALHRGEFEPDDFAQAAPARA